LFEEEITKFYQMRRDEEGQGLLAQMDCAELWNVTTGKTNDIPIYSMMFHEPFFGHS
jgi:hypothetical protein